MKRTLIKYGKYTLTLEQGWIDRRELKIVLTVSSILAIVLVGKLIGFDVIESWLSWIRLR